MIVQLSHPWRWHRTLDILDTEAGDLTEVEAGRLVRGGIARDVADVVEDLGGGWYSVPLADGTDKKVRGLPAAVRTLRRQAW